MKYMILMSYKVEGVPPLPTWDPADIERHIQFQQDLGQELSETGELVDGQGLSQEAKTVVYDGTGEPAVTDGPFPESKELLAGYWMVDVESEQRAIEIAGKASAAPGPGGRPLRHPLELRAVISVPATEEA